MLESRGGASSTKTTVDARRLLLHAVFAVSVMALAACGGGGHSSTAGAAAIPLVSTPASNANPPPEPALSSLPGSSSNAAQNASAVAPNKPADTAPVAVHLSYVLPANDSGSRGQASRMRRREFISPSNTLISITVTPLGGSGTVYGPSACTSGTCTISFTATPGPNTIAFTFTDGSSNVLSRFSTTTIVQPSTLNTLKFSANPVVNSVSLSLASSTINAGTASNVLLSVTARDVDNNIIAGSDNFVDANGNQLSLILSVNNVQSGGDGTMRLQGPSRINSPNQALTYLRYDGKWMDHADVSVSSASSIPGGMTGATLASQATAVEYPSGTSAGGGSGIASGPDGNLWYVDYAGAKVDRMTLQGVPASFPCGCSEPIQIVAGPDGNMWFTSGTFGPGGLNKITMAGVPSVASSSVANPLGIVLGSDGKLWYSSGNGQLIGYIAPAGAPVSYPTSGYAFGITFGQDGLIYYLDRSANAVKKMNRFGTILATFPVGGSGIGFNATGITLGPDGNVWFAAPAAAIVGKITPGGTMTPYALPTGSYPVALTVGPDNNIWVSENGLNQIARVTTSGGITQYGTAAGISSSSGPYGITLGPDNNIWIVEQGANKIAKFVL